MMRSAVNNANSTYDSATQNASQYGGQAQQVNGQLMPFLTQRLNDPQGYSQGDLGAMLANAMGSGGGATSGITGQANLTAGRTRNDAGFQTGLAEAARARTKALGDTSERIASDNAGVKLGQQDSAAKMLAGLYGTDVGAQSDAENQRIGATNAATDASKVGWLQNTLSFADTAANVINALKKK